jgi:hypothetical protein
MPTGTVTGSCPTWVATPAPRTISLMKPGKDLKKCFFCIVLHVPTCVKDCLICDKELSKSLSTLIHLLPGNPIVLFITLNPDVTLFLAADFTGNSGQSDESCCTYSYFHKELAEVHKPQSETTIIESFSGGNWPLFSIFWYFCHHFNLLPHQISLLCLLDSQRFLSKS